MIIKIIAMVVTVLLVFFMNSVKAQVNEKDGKPGPVIYLEGYGNNLTYSLNYEGLAFSIGKVHSMYRIGFGAVPHRYGIPVGLHFLKGRKGEYLDLGVGFSYVNGGQVISGSSHPTIRGEGIFFTPTIGYRRQLSGKGLFFRVNAGMAFKLKEYNPLMGSPSTLPLIGLSFGRSF